METARCGLCGQRIAYHSPYGGADDWYSFDRERNAWRKECGLPGAGGQKHIVAVAAIETGGQTTDLIRTTPIQMLTSSGDGPNVEAEVTGVAAIGNGENT